MFHHRHIAPILRFKARAFAVMLPLALAVCGGGTSGLPGFDSGTPAAGGGAPTGQTIGTGKVKVGLILPLTAEG